MLFKSLNYPYTQWYCFALITAVCLSPWYKFGWNFPISPPNHSAILLHQLLDLPNSLIRINAHTWYLLDLHGLLDGKVFLLSPFYSSNPTFPCHVDPLSGTRSPLPHIVKSLYKTAQGSRKRRATRHPRQSLTSAYHESAKACFSERGTGKPAIGPP